MANRFQHHPLLESYTGCYICQASSGETTSKAASSQAQSLDVALSQPPSSGQCKHPTQTKHPSIRAEFSDHEYISTCGQMCPFPGLTSHTSSTHQRPTTAQHVVVSIIDTSQSTLLVSCHQPLSTNVLFMATRPRRHVREKFPLCKSGLFLHCQIEHDETGNELPQEQLDIGPSCGVEGDVNGSAWSRPASQPASPTTIYHTSPWAFQCTPQARDVQPAVNITIEPCFPSSTCFASNQYVSSDAATLPVADTLICTTYVFLYARGYLLACNVVSHIDFFQIGVLLIQIIMSGLCFPRCTIPIFLCALRTISPPTASYAPPPPRPDTQPYPTGPYQSGITKVKAPPPPPRPDTQPYPTGPYQSSIVKGRAPPPPTRPDTQPYPTGPYQSSTPCFK